MEITTLSKQRGIIAFYSQDRYIIYSTYYGVVAESDPITRIEFDEKHVPIHLDNIDINFNICKWYGYWSLKNIITRGIKKVERENASTEATITYHEVEGTCDHLKKRLVVKTEEY